MFEDIFVLVHVYFQHIEFSRGPFSFIINRCLEDLVAGRKLSP